jgi:hypothetical protein
MTETRPYSRVRAISLSLTPSRSEIGVTAPSATRGWAGIAHCRFLPLMFCLLLCLQAAASAQIQETFTDADGNDLWSDGKNWSPTTAKGGPNGNFNVTIPAGVGGPTGGAILDVSASVANVTINALGSLYITNGSTLTITGTTITNNGQLALTDLSGFAKGGNLTLNGMVVLSGSGTTIMNSSVRSFILGKGTLINQQALSGVGSISVALQNQGPNGMITGGTPTNPLALAGLVTNTGTISGQGNTTIDIYVTVQNDGGTIDATDSGVINLLYCTINGGTIGSASVPEGYSASLNGVTITGTYSILSTQTASASTRLYGTITNNGDIVVTSNPGYASAQLLIPEAVTLAGTGAVTMSGSNASITSDNKGATLTNLSPHVIYGGNITNLATLTNKSTLDEQLSISVTEVENFNASTYAPELIDGGTINGGTIEGASSGTTLEGGAVLGSATLTGGDIICAKCTLNSDTISTTVEVLDGDTLTLQGTEVINSPGELFLDAISGTATAVDNGTVTLMGTGAVVTSTSPNNFIVGQAGKSNSLTIDTPTVNFAGTIGDGSTMNVTIGTPAIVTNIGAPLIFNVGNNKTFNNLGTLVEPSSTIEILGNFKNYNATTNTLSGGTYTLGGPLQFNNANIVTNAAKISFTSSGGKIVDQNGNNGLLNLNNTTTKGTFSLSNENFDPLGTYTNAGTTTISSGSFFNIGGTSTDYSQSATTAVTTVDGQITVPAGGLANFTGGTAQGAGAFSGNVSVGNPSGGAPVTFIVGDSKKVSALVTMLNDYTQLATGVMDVQIGGTNPGTQYSQIKAYGTVQLGGTLTVSVINKFKAVSGDQFTIIDAPAGVTGTFAKVNLPANYSVVYNSTGVVLEYQ